MQVTNAMNAQTVFTKQIPQVMKTVLVRIFKNAFI